MSSSKYRSKLSAEDFRALHHAYRDRLLSSLAARVGDPDKAEEIAAAAFRRAWEKRETFRGESSFYTWIYAIAFNEARAAWRAEATRDRMSELLTGELGNGSLVSDALERKEHVERIRKGLQRIPAKYRRVLRDHFIRGYSVKQIARRERIPCGTVLSRIFMGKRRLRLAWEALT